MVFLMKETLGFCFCFVENTKIISKTRKKVSISEKNACHKILIIDEKMLIVEFSYNFLYIPNCTKVTDKHFYIHESCMTNIFGTHFFFLIHILCKRGGKLLYRTAKV